MTAIEVLSKGTVKAAWLILTVTKGVDPDTVDCEVLAASVKAVLSDSLDKIKAEWKDATEAHMPSAWLRELVNAQCNECGLLAVNAYLKREVA